jgi:hypothetical protein
MAMHLYCMRVYKTRLWDRVELESHPGAARKGHVIRHVRPAPQLNTQRLMNQRNRHVRRHVHTTEAVTPASGSWRQALTWRFHGWTGRFEAVAVGGHRLGRLAVAGVSAK